MVECNKWDKIPPLFYNIELCQLVWILFWPEKLVCRFIIQNYSFCHLMNNISDIKLQFFSFPGQNDIQTRRRSSILSNGGGILSHLSRSTILSIFVVVLLIFLFCSSMYLVFRVDSLQRQVRI